MFGRVVGYFHRPVPFTQIPIRSKFIFVGDRDRIQHGLRFRYRDLYLIGEPFRRHRNGRCAGRNRGQRVAFHRDDRRIFRRDRKLGVLRRKTLG